MHRFALYSPPRGTLAQQLPVSPFVSLVVASHVAQAGELFLSAQLMTDSEIDFEVDALIKELEVFRTSAKKKLRALKALAVSSSTKEAT